jgi:ADP-ribose pyrophosphatase YjhB (NUDIX family)
MTDGSPESCSFTRRVPDGDNRERLVCDDCGYILYDNPKIVVGAVCTWEDRILLCRRAIEPRTGFWTMPAGFLELSESCEEGASREAWEEAEARLDIDCLLAVYSIPRISQVQIIYRARLLTPQVAPGPESQEVRLFGWDEIPWDDLAFPSVHWSLRHFHQTREQKTFPAFAAPPGQGIPRP